jgi:hypothetical protein
LVPIGRRSACSGRITAAAGCIATGAAPSRTADGAALCTGQSAGASTRVLSAPRATPRAAEDRIARARAFRVERAVSAAAGGQRSARTNTPRRIPTSHARILRSVAVRSTATRSATGATLFSLLARPIPARLVAEHARTAFRHDTAAGRRRPVLLAGLRGPCRTHLRQPFQPPPRLIDGPLLDLGKRWIPRRKLERPVFIDELVTEFATP